MSDSCGSRAVQDDGVGGSAAGDHAVSVDVDRRQLTAELENQPIDTFVRREEIDRSDEAYTELSL